MSGYYKYKSKFLCTSSESTHFDVRSYETMSLTVEKIEQFIWDGVVVIENVIPQDEIDTIRSSFHDCLLSLGVDSTNIEACLNELKSLSSTGGAGGILDIFYPPWRIQLGTDSRLFALISQLWSATYGMNHEYFPHPYGPFDGTKGYTYIDRVGFRIPSTLAETLGSGERVPKNKFVQRSLTPHLDCCPHNMYNNDKEFPRWRPLQAFLSLTSNNDANSGGFECCKGFHREFDTFSFSRIPSFKSPELVSLCLGDYTHIRPREDQHIFERMESIQYPAGSLVIWDQRIPHSNSYRNDSSVIREVVYTNFLPYVDINKRFAFEQLRRYRDGLIPTDQWLQAPGDGLEVSRTSLESRLETESNLNDHQKRLLGILPWDD